MLELRLFLNKNSVINGRGGGKLLFVGKLIVIGV